MKPKIWWRVAFCGVMLALGLASAAQAAGAPSASASGQAASTSPVYSALALGLASAPQPANGPSASANGQAVGTGGTVGQQRLQRDAVCTKCHDESETKPILALYQRPHGAVGDPNAPGCRTCHGDSADHVAGSKESSEHRPRPDMIFGSKLVNGFEPNTPQQQSEVCLGCHKSGLRMRWPGSQHESNDLACTSCHVNHKPGSDPMLVKTEQPAVCEGCHREKRAEVKKISAHPIEAGKMACSDCHNPHGSPGPKLLAKNTVTETCWQCHADKRGPFLWEHEPVVEDCTNCHNPHGSNITPLLKSRPPFLCDECHDGPHASGSPYGTAVGGIQGGGVAAGGNPSSTPVGRACMNCHVMIHGSNSPAGAYLHR